MSTTVEDLKGWYKEGKKNRATHMIVVCDTYDWEDYPVYVKKGEDVKRTFEKYSGPNMQKVMEVYDLSLPFDGQKMVETVFGSRAKSF